MLNHSEGSLSIVAHTASDLANVETLGKQDPYLRFTVNLAEKDSWQKTYTHKNAGTTATWNQSFETGLHGEPNLYIEVLDEESGVDELIGFAAIPLAQVAQAPGGNFNGVFTIFTVKAKNAGVVHLNLTVRGFNSPPGYNQYQQPVQGRSFIDEEHAARVKSMRKKEVGASVGTAVLGGALAIGAGLLGRKLYQDHEREEQEEEQRQEEFAQEKQRLEEDRARMDRERQEWESRQQQETRQEEYHQEGRGHEEYRREEHHSRRSGGANEWNPVGTYSPGDRVVYHGQEYLCLQGHTSNPTWMPGAAHSLWQAA